MKLLRLIAMFLLSCFVSMFVFPIGFSFFPASLNTKMVIGVLGIVAYIWDSIHKREATFHKTTLFALMLAMVFSVWCFFTMVANGTPDTSYATYFVSFSVWLGGAYAVCAMIRGFHGKINLPILVQYLVFVSVAQCALALAIDHYPGFKAIVDTYVQQGQEFFTKVHRLYGIGAALDPAGCRFAIILTLLAHLVSTDDRVVGNRLQLFLALVSFCIITIVGCMISRTTIVGTGLGLAYMFFWLAMPRRGVLTRRKLRFLGSFVGIVAIAVVISVWQYITSPESMANFRFAFEPFFNYFETGEFSSGSTDKLNGTMWIWPDTTREWLIGTGWFGFFHFSTDIGYCRFVLYCGVIGLSLFSLFFLYDASVVWRKFKDFKFVTLLLVVLTFVIWIKVATDIFWIYALLFCLPYENGEPEADPEPEE